MASFTDLETWKQARKIRNLISNMVKDFPSDEKFRLADQVIRSSRSIGNNLAGAMAGFIIRIISDFVLWQEAL